MELPIQQLIDISRRYGADNRWVIAGGGNTSYKDSTKLWVKASGHALATIGEEGFAVLDRARLTAMENKEYSQDIAEREAQVKDDLAVLTTGEGGKELVYLGSLVNLTALLFGLVKRYNLKGIAVLLDNSHLRL